MKILFDTQIYDWQISGGISRYFTEVINRLDNDPQIDIQFKCRHTYNRYIQNSKWLELKPIAKGLEIKGKLRLIKYLNQNLNRKYSNKILKGAATDVFHPTYYDPYFLKFLGKTAFVLTVHDLTTEKLQNGEPKTKEILEWKERLIHRADHIIAVSENTRKDIIDFYKVNNSKISTAYLASNLLQNNKNEIVEQISLPKQYILFLGSRSGYKNFIAFINEVTPLIKKFGISLVLAGGGKLNANESVILKDLGISNMCFLFPDISDNLLIKIYKEAILFVFPSLYEGFGIPVIEAMECGCPVLLSNNSSLPEVGGPAAAYFDPKTKGSLYSELKALLESSERLNSMRALGIEQAKRFCWDKTSSVHKKVYQLLLN